MEKSRSEYVFRNATTAIGLQIFRNILSFVNRVIFIQILDVEYLGVNSLFSQILTVLSFAELGIGNAIIYSLYKPIAEKDKERLKSLMQLYAVAYKGVGIVIGIAGVLLIPFLPYLVGEVSYVKENLVFLYLLFLINTVASYFFGHKKSFIIANQQNYLVALYTEAFHVLQIVLQCVFLVLTKDIVVYIFLMILCTILNNIFIARKADKMYPFLKEKDVRKLSVEESKGIFQNVKSLFIYRVGGIVLESTDSIFISAMLNVLTVGLYDNYKMIVGVFKTVGRQVFTSITASIGNLNTEEDVQKKENVFFEMLYLHAWYYGFTAVGLVLFLNTVINLMGKNLFIETSAVYVTCFYYYLYNMHTPSYMYRTTTGLFKRGRFVPVMAAILNIAFNFILGIPFGLTGILFASVIARVCTYEIVDPILLFKNVFKKNPLIYYMKYAKYLAISLTGLFGSVAIINRISLDGMVGFFVKVAIVSVIYNIIFFAFTIPSREFKALLQRVKFLKKRN